MLFPENTDTKTGLTMPKPEIDELQAESIVQKPEIDQQQPELIVRKPEMVQQKPELIVQQPILIDPGPGSNAQNGELGVRKKEERRKAEDKKRRREEDKKISCARINPGRGETLAYRYICLRVETLRRNPVGKGLNPTRQRLTTSATRETSFA